MDIKYIKYKTKYLNLKGGSVIQKDSVDNLIDVIHDGSLDITDKIKKLTNLIDEHEKKILNHKNKDGLTPLNEAIKKDFDSICKLFIENDVDVNLLDINKDPPLILAWIYKKYKICKLLLECDRININCQGKNGFTLLHYVENVLPIKLLSSDEDHDLKFVIEYIIKNGDINVLDEKGLNPLFYAITRNNLKFICMLRGKKANADVKYDGKTILEIAKIYEKKNENGSRILQYLELNYPKLNKKQKF